MGKANGTNGTNGINRVNGKNGTNGSTHTNGATNGHQNGHQNGTMIPQHLPVLRTPKTTRKADAGTHQLVLLPFSAHNDSSLKANIDVLPHVIDQHSLADVAHTLATKRSKLAKRTFRIVDKDNVAQGLLDDVQNVFSSLLPETPRLGFVFTGQGAQWPASKYSVSRNASLAFDYVERRKCFKPLEICSSPSSSPKMATLTPRL
jgi:hypothetical protein